MTDIVEELRYIAEIHADDPMGMNADLAADEIEDRDTEIARLRALITEWAESEVGVWVSPNDRGGDSPEENLALHDAAMVRVHAARAALREEANR